MNILFVCNQNQNRSRTAEELFKEQHSTRSAGLYNDSPVKEEELRWAEVIIVMEDSQRQEISERFPEVYLQKKILSLNIPDIYSYNQPKLVGLLKEKMAGLL